MRGKINDKGLADEQRGRSKGGMEASALIKATKGRGRGIISALAAAAGLPVSASQRFTRNELWVVSQIIQERKAACTDIHPSSLLFSLLPPPQHTHTHTPSSVLRIHLQIEQIYHSVGGAGEGGGPWNALALRCSSDGRHAPLTVTRCACSPRVATAATQVPQPFPSYVQQNPPKQLDRPTPTPTHPANQVGTTHPSRAQPQAPVVPVSF